MMAHHNAAAAATVLPPQLAAAVIHGSGISHLSSFSHALLRSLPTQIVSFNSKKSVLAENNILRLTLMIITMRRYKKTLFTNIKQTDIADELASMCRSNFISELVHWRRPKTFLCHLLQLTDWISPIIFFGFHRKMSRTIANTHRRTFNSICKTSI